VYTALADFDGVSANQSHSQNVETASHRVDVGTRLDAERQRQKLLPHSDDRIVRSGWRDVSDLDADVCSQPLFKTCVEGKELRRRPIDAGQRPKKVGTHQGTPGSHLLARLGARGEAGDGER
jgi:hypothetical protein